MAKKKTTAKKKVEKAVTRYTYDKIREPRTPETGHTALLPGEEQVVALPMDSGWSRAIDVGRLAGTEEGGPTGRGGHGPCGGPCAFLGR